MSNSAKVKAIGASLTLSALAGCATVPLPTAAPEKQGQPSSPAFVTFSKCIQELRAAPHDDAFLNCLTGKALADLKAAKAEMSASEFEALVLENLPTNLSLYRETLAPDDDVATLLMAAGEPPYATPVEAKMVKIDGAWRFADGDNGGLNSDFTPPVQPASVTLSFDGAVEWGDRFLTFAPMGPQSCDIFIRHIFGEAAIRIVASCEIADAPGSHALPINRNDGSPARIDALIPGVDAVPANGAGKLVITDASTDLVSGFFEYEMWFNSGDTITARGAFDNIPVTEE